MKDDFTRFTFSGSGIGPRNNSFNKLPTYACRTLKFESHCFWIFGLRIWSHEINIELGGEVIRKERSGEKERNSELSVRC